LAAVLDYGVVTEVLGVCCGGFDVGEGECLDLRGVEDEV